MRYFLASEGAPGRRAIVNCLGFIVILLSVMVFSLISYAISVRIASGLTEALASLLLPSFSIFLYRNSIKTLLNSTSMVKSRVTIHWLVSALRSGVCKGSESTLATAITEDRKASY